jgi:apolipoprotein N-acyltransferase
MIGRFLSIIAGLRGWRATIAAFGFGALSSAALPPLHLVPVLLVSVPVLLALLNGTPGPAVAARRGFWFGFGHHLIGLYWITEAILIEAARFWWFVPIAVPALAAVLAGFIAIACAVARCAPAGWRRALALAGAWVVADLARQFVATGFPWNLWGSVWEFPGVVGDVFIQPAALIGVHGLTLLTLLIAVTPGLSNRWRVAGGVLLIGWIVFGMVRLSRPLPEAPRVKVVLVQGNVAEGQKWDRALVDGIFDRYLTLGGQAMTEAGTGRGVVIWPETASPFQLQTDLLARQMIAAAARGAPALVGAVRFDADGMPRNSLFALTAGGEVAGVYDKGHLVPFGEYSPDWFPFGLQVAPGGGFARGPGPRTLHVPGLPPVGPLICYEAIFPGQVVNRADRPDWLVNITNDAWFGNSTGPRQHLAAARLRAVEEGLPLLRAANTGISAGFDPRGHELGRLGMNQAATLTLFLPPALPATPFARFGLIIPAFLAAAFLGLAFLGRRNAATG